jgi:thiol-disulfide isomerase/thioredoxin
MSEKTILRRRNAMLKQTLILLIFVTTLIAQDGITVIDEKSESPMLLGRHSRIDFMDSSFVGWFNEEFDSYKIDEECLSPIKEKMNDVKTTIVMGTWCSDSKREVPHFYKIVDFLKYDESNIDLICVDRAKVGVADEVDGLNIELVPTFIFSKDGEEIGRIIEAPIETLEIDLANILK